MFLLVILALAHCSSANDAVENDLNQARTTGALDFTVQVCSSLGNCQPLATGLVVDNNWRGVYYNLCYDPKRCDKVYSSNLMLIVEWMLLQF